MAGLACHVTPRHVLLGNIAASALRLRIRNVSDAL
jgi:hypothetical protein